jgi:hypothetical protein
MLLRAPPRVSLFLLFSVGGVGDGLDASVGAHRRSPLVLGLGELCSSRRECEVGLPSSFCGSRRRRAHRRRDGLSAALTPGLPVPSFCSCFQRR